MRQNKKNDINYKDLIFIIPTPLIILLFASAIFLIFIFPSTVEISNLSDIRGIIDFLNLNNFKEIEIENQVQFESKYLIRIGLQSIMIIAFLYYLVALAWEHARVKQNIKRTIWKDSGFRILTIVLSAILIACIFFFLYLVYDQDFKCAYTLTKYQFLPIIPFAILFLYSIIIAYGPTIKWFLVNYTQYFYITFLYIIVLVFIFTKVDQSDAFFLELFEEGSRNHLFILMAYLIPTSLIIVWYVPYYLYFSKTFYRGIESRILGTKPGERDKLRNAFFQNKLRYYLNLILPVRALYSNSQEVMTYLQNYNKAPNSQSYTSNYNTSNSGENLIIEREKEHEKYFHRTRRVLGIAYVFSFIYIFEQLLVKVEYDNKIVENASAIGLVIIIIFYGLMLRQMQRLFFHKKGILIYDSNQNKENSTNKNNADAAYHNLQKNQTSAIEGSKTDDDDNKKNIKNIFKPDFRNTIWWPLLGWALFYCASFSSIYTQTKPIINAYTITLFLIGLGLVYFIVNYFIKRFGNESKGKPVEINIIERIEVKYSYHANLTILAFILTTTILVILVCLKHENTVWNQSFYFLIFLFFFLWSFMGFAFYRRFSRNYEFESQVFQSRFLNSFFQRIDQVFTSLMLLLILLMSGIFIGSFLGGLIHFDTVIYEKISTLKTINIFFIFLNGLFAFVALLHRYFILRNQLSIYDTSDPQNICLDKEINNQYDEYKNIIINDQTQVGYDPINGYEDDSEDQKLIVQESNQVIIRFKQKENSRFFFAGIFYAIILLGFYYYFQGNGYHTINYVEVKPEFIDTMIDIKEYTYRFLERKKKNNLPIVLIASDGGGVKAAYWTMRVIEKLENEFPGIYKNNVFITSGASGGSIGLGMYSYFSALGLSKNNISMAIDTIGKTNFLNKDLTGVFTRWPLKSLPDVDKRNWKDRMDLMSNKYIDLTNLYSEGNESLKYEIISQQPFSYLWSTNNYELPLYIMNTAQMEEGKKGIAHPLDVSDTPALIEGMIDLNQNIDSNYINFPDALFTTNRFPLMSPKAKIEGKGHFFDVGAIENSGVETILRFLDYMNGEISSNQDSIFQMFFDQEIILISIRSAKSRYIYDEFSDYKNEVNTTSELSNAVAIISGVSNDGMTGKPRYYEDIMKDTIIRKGTYGIHEFETVNIPFRISDNGSDVENVLGGDIWNYTTRLEIQDGVDSLNSRLDSLIKEGRNELGINDTIYLEPPLGRLMVKSSREFMDIMSGEEVKDAIQKIVIMKKIQEKKNLKKKE